MPKFRYSAIRDNGERVSGEIEGGDRSIVLGRLSEQGLHPIDVRSPEQEISASRMLSFGGGTASFKELSIFTRELGWLLRAGMTLNAALDILAKESFTRSFSTLIATLRTDIRKGRSFHEALADTGAFSQYYISMIEVGEASGTLPSVLDRISATREREQKIRNRLVSALIYPSLLVALAFGAVIFIMVSVVPSIKDMIVGSGAPIPDSAQLVIDLSDWIIESGMTALVSIPLIVIVLLVLLGGRQVQRLMAGIAIRLPLVGSLLRKSAVVQFCRILGTLLGAGVSLPDSLRLMRNSAGLPRIATVIAEMQDALRRGENFILPLERSSLFPKLLARMLSVGNETGNLTTSVVQVTEILEEELDRQVDRTLTLLEPAIILVLSGMVAFIITSLMSAIISINDLAL
jgi:general secretion pathway protein F